MSLPYLIYVCERSPKYFLSMVIVRIAPAILADVSELNWWFIPIHRPCWFITFMWHIYTLSICMIRDDAFINLPEDILNYHRRYHIFLGGVWVCLEYISVGKPPRVQSGQRLAVLVYNVRATMVNTAWNKDYWNQFTVSCLGSKFWPLCMAFGPRKPLQLVLSYTGLQTLISDQTTQGTDHRCLSTL